MPREKREIETGLSNKGFVKRDGDHNYFIYVSLAGKKSMAKTKTSLGRGFDIDDNLLGQMARQCGLTKKRFLDLVDCPLQRPDYEVLLKQSNKL
jgi:hypothetical protein